MAPSSAAVDAMVKHPVFTAIERRWQLPVYFQLRWKEIVAPLEDALSATKLEPSSDKGQSTKASVQCLVLINRRQCFRVKAGDGSLDRSRIVLEWGSLHASARASFLEVDSASVESIPDVARAQSICS